jgi:hypothetical protein
MTNAPHLITYTKLRNGNWGVRGFRLLAGITITVTKKDGTVKTEKIDRILWQGDDGMCLATIIASEPSYDRRSSSKESNSGRCRACGGPIVNTSYQHAMHGYCGACAFDEI